MIEIIYGWELNPEFMTAPSSQASSKGLPSGLRGNSGLGRREEVLGLIRRVVRYLIPPSKSGGINGEYAENAFKDASDAITRLYPVGDSGVETRAWEDHLEEIKKGRLTDAQVLAARAIFHSRFSYSGVVSNLVFNPDSYYSSVNLIARPTKGNYIINRHVKEFVDELGGGLSQEEIDAELANRAAGQTKNLIQLAYPTLRTNGGELIVNEDGTSGPGFDTFIDEFSKALEEILRLANQIDFYDVLFVLEVENNA